MPQDKQLHALYGAGVAAIAILLGLGFVGGILAAVVVGLGKELRDLVTGKGHPEVPDFLATVLGGLIGAVLGLLALAAYNLMTG